jgi:glutaredoxin
MAIRLAGIVLLAFATAVAGQTVYRWLDQEGRVHYADQSPPQDAKQVQEKRLGSPNFVETSGATYAMIRAQENFPVTLYTAPDCSAECKAARDFLGRRGVPYVEVQISSAPDAAQYRQTFGGEEIFVPAVTAGGQKQKGFESAAWTRLLDDVGYPKAPPPGATAAGSPTRPAPGGR